MFSARLPSFTSPNALTRRLAELRATGVAIADLTESNPTRAGIAYPPGLLAPLGSDAALRYDPQPFGLASARAAVAADHARRGAQVDPAHVVLTASTSEAYAWLFKLLCNPGDSVLIPTPSYPLFEHLTALEGIRAHGYALEYHARWEIDFATLEAAPATTRAVVVVSPNNPTGSYLSRGEFDRLAAACADRGWALIADEVFADYRLDADDPFTDLAARPSPCLTFTLGGFSKSLGLPQLKLGWIVAGGPAELRDAALGHLEFIADSYLSVGTPVQDAAPVLLSTAAAVRAAIHARVSRNLASLRRHAGSAPAASLLRVEGGWSAPVRVPATHGEEQLALDLLETERILVYPGYFFDFPRDAHVIVSLLAQEDVFDSAVPRLLTAACS